MANTRKLTLKQDMYFIPERGDGLCKRMAGDKVSVALSAGIGYATAYTQAWHGQMMSSAINVDKTDARSLFKNWPKDWPVPELALESVEATTKGA